MASEMEVSNRHSQTYPVRPHPEKGGHIRFPRAHPFLKATLGPTTHSEKSFVFASDGIKDKS
jgi:hypothetical protein